MKTLTKLALALLLAIAAAPLARAADGKLAVVAAENFYGDIARQIGGAQVDVVSIMNNPEQDPHLFETTPGIVRQIADAQIVILNGANYDPWMEKLLAAAPRPGPHRHHRRSAYGQEARRQSTSVVRARHHAGGRQGDCRRLQLKPTARTPPTMPRGSRRRSPRSSASRSASRRSRAKHAGEAVTATEPVFGPMADALGLTMRNQRFALAMMNDTEPSARDVAAFENDLKQHKVKLLLYNKQVSEKLTERLRDIANKAKVPVVGVTETQPANVSFQDWMLGSSTRSTRR